MRRLLPLLAVLCAAGCVILPTGQMRLTPASRRPMRDRQLEALTPGTSRADVLMALGGPELQLDGGRLLIYQWGTGMGIVGTQYVAVPVTVTFHDQLFEFDERGMLVRSGDLKTLLEEGWWSERLRPPPLPAEIPVAAGRRKIVLLLGAEVLTVEEDARKSACYRVPRGGVEELGYRSDREAAQWGPLRPYRIRLVDEAGERHDLKLQIDVPNLLSLVAYLREHTPAVRIED